MHLSHHDNVFANNTAFVCFDWDVCIAYLCMLMDVLVNVNCYCIGLVFGFLGIILIAA